MQSIASMMAEDFLCFPLNRDALQDCVDYMTVCSVTQSGRNQICSELGARSLLSNLLQSLLPDSTNDWDDIHLHDD